MIIKESFQYSVIFLVIGFIGLAGSHYGNVIDSDSVLGFSLAVSVIGFIISLGFLIEAMNKELRNEKKQD